MSSSFDHFITANCGIEKIITDLVGDFQNVNISSQESHPECIQNCSALKDVEESLKSREEDFLNCINDFMNANKDLMDIRHKLFSSNLNSISQNLIPSKKNDERMQWCTDIKSHLEKIVENKALLAWFLQQSTSPNFLILQHSFHECLTRLIVGFITLISDFDSELLNDTTYPVLEDDDSYDTVLRARESIKKCIENLHKLNGETEASLLSSSGIHTTI